MKNIKIDNIQEFSYISNNNINKFNLNELDFLSSDSFSYKYKNDFCNKCKCNIMSFNKNYANNINYNRNKRNRCLNNNNFYTKRLKYKHYDNKSKYNNINYINLPKVKNLDRYNNNYSINNTLNITNSKDNKNNNSEVNILNKKRLKIRNDIHCSKKKFDKNKSNVVCEIDLNEIDSSFTLKDKQYNISSNKNNKDRINNESNNDSSDTDNSNINIDNNISNKYDNKKITKIKYNTYELIDDYNNNDILLEGIKKINIK